MADGAGGEGRASHGMDPKDFHHTGLRLDWGHAHAPDGFEVFSLAVSPDGTAVCAGGACPADPGCARVWVWLLGEEDAVSEETMTRRVERARSGARASTAADVAASSTARRAHVLRAEGAVAALSVAVAGDVVVSGMADGSVWAWNLRDGTLRWGGRECDPHPALAKLPRRRRRDRNPFAAFVGRVDPGGFEPRQVRFLIAPPTPPPAANAAGRLPETRFDPPAARLVVGSVGGHAVFPVWDAGTGEPPSGESDHSIPELGGHGRGWEEDSSTNRWYAEEPAASYARDDPWRASDGRDGGDQIAPHVASSRDGRVLYVTSLDAKEVRAWRIRSGGGDTAVFGTNGAATRAWTSERLAVRGLRLAGLTSLPRTRGVRRGDAAGGDAAGGELVATCCAPMVDGTCYAAPDAPIKVVLIDAEDGQEVRRFELEGVTACNRFIDCGSLAGGGGGTLLFLAHRDGSIWIHAARSGAQIAALHAHSTWAGTSGHHRLLPACVAIVGDGEFLWAATTDGQCVHRYQVGPPRTWTRGSHRRFPAAFRRAVRTLVTSVHVRNARGRAGLGGPLGSAGAVLMSAGPGLRGEQIGDGFSGKGAAQLWGEGFAEVCAIEPAILELVVARIARLTHGSCVET